jgi:hypothetical protein
MFASLKVIEAHGDLKNRSALALPFFPGLSAALHQKNPLWEIYALFPRVPLFQRQEISRLAANPPEVIIISTAAMDGRAELAYPASHPLIYRYIEDHYQQLALPGLAPGLEFFLRRPEQVVDAPQVPG